jgi:hypothetical protein
VNDPTWTVVLRDTHGSGEREYDQGRETLGCTIFEERKVVAFRPFTRIANAAS